MEATCGACRGHIMAVVIGLTGITFLNNAILCNMYHFDGLSPVPTGTIYLFIHRSYIYDSTGFIY